MSHGYATEADAVKRIAETWRRLLTHFLGPRDSFGRVPVEIGEAISELIYWGKKTGPRTDVMLCGQMTGRALGYFYSNEDFDAIKKELLAMARAASLDLEFQPSDQPA